MRTVFIFRHAHRPEFQDGDFGNEVSITDEGKERARKLGRSLLSSPIEMIYTSPILRCVQTAEEIRVGMGKDIPISASKMLGDPGFFIDDRKHAGKAFLTQSTREIIQKVIKGMHLPGFRRLEESCRSFLSYIVSFEENSALITHDISICLLACWMFQSTEGDKYIPDFLEGMVLTHDTQEMRVKYKKHEKVWPIRFLH